MDGAEWRIASPVSFGLQVSFGLPSVILSASEESHALDLSIRVNCQVHLNHA